MLFRSRVADLLLLSLFAVASIFVVALDCSAQGQPTIGEEYLATTPPTNDTQSGDAMRKLEEFRSAALAAYASGDIEAGDDSSLHFEFLASLLAGRRNVVQAEFDFDKAEKLIFLGAVSDAVRLIEVAEKNTCLVPDMQNRFCVRGQALRALADFKEGRLELAQSGIKEVLNFQLSEVSPDDGSVAQSEFYLAEIHAAKRELDTALEIHKRAHDVRLALFGLSDDRTVASRFAIARILMSLGQVEESISESANALLALRGNHDTPEATRDYFQRLLALQLADAAFSKAAPETRLVNLVGLLLAEPQLRELARNENRGLLKYYLSRVNAADRSKGRSYLPTANDLDVLAKIAAIEGRGDLSIRLLERSYLIKHSNLGAMSPHVILSLVDLSNGYSSELQFAKALRAALEAATRVEASRNEDPIVQASVFNAIANALYSESTDAAIFFQKRAVNALQKRREILESESEKSQSIFLTTFSDQYLFLQELLITQGRFAEAEEVGRMLKEQEYFNFIQRDSAGGDPRRTQSELTEREEAWSAQLGQWMQRPNKIASEANMLTARKEAGEKLTDLELRQLTDLNEQYELAYATYQISVSEWLSEVRASAGRRGLAEVEGLQKLADDARQEEIARLGSDVALVQIVALDDALHFFIITPSAFNHVSHPVARRDVFLEIDKARKLIEKSVPRKREGQTSASLAEDNKAMNASLRSLYKMLIEPIREDLHDAGAHTLMLNLQGQLRYMPAAALYDGEQYLAEQFDIVMFTPAANTTFDGRGELNSAAGFGVTRASEGFSALPAVADELGALMAPDGVGTVFQGVSKLDEDFTRTALEASLSGTSAFLHIASHFSMRPGDETRSFLLLGDGQHLTLSDINTSAKLRFRNVELLTLSACSTALSGEGTGAEVEGLGVLAQLRGADSVLATLWSVADRSSPVFMTAFYRRLIDPAVSKASALSNAQREMIASEDFNHPFYWRSLCPDGRLEVVFDADERGSYSTARFHWRLASQTSCIMRILGRDLPDRF